MMLAMSEVYPLLNRIRETVDNLGDAAVAKSYDVEYQRMLTNLIKDLSEFTKKFGRYFDKDAKEAMQRIQHLLSDEDSVFDENVFDLVRNLLDTIEFSLEENSAE